jgi:cytidine deaminase
MSLVIDWEAMFTAAEAARKRAHAKYSKFHVGAALFCADGTIVPGCNVENASYGLTICAERSAIARMVCEGKKLVAVAIVVDSTRPTPPCGMCRQVMAEFGPSSMEVRSRNIEGSEEKYTLGELLPHAFTAEFL